MGSDQFKQKAREIIADWESALNPPDRFLFFQEIEGIQPFSPGTLTDFSLTNAWWLAELCRLAYTPDSKEARYFRNRKKPPRSNWLEPQTTFREVHSIHKTGNHASIYLGETPEGERFTVLCFRGTSRFRQWVMNFTAMAQPWEYADGSRGHNGAYVHAGFDLLNKRVWSQLHSKLMSLPRPFIFTGHSLGGALATLAAVEEKPDLLLTFGAPRVGNAVFNELLDEIPHYRFINDLDLVPQVPPSDPNAGAKEYHHHGQRILLGTDGEITHQEEVPEVLNAMGLLREAFSKPVPPDFIIDHLMTSYCRKLRSQIDSAAE